MHYLCGYCLKICPTLENTGVFCIDWYLQSAAPILWGKFIFARPFSFQFFYPPFWKVGSYLKTPRYPVWVVCSESHFSVLFSLKKNLLSDWKAEKNFDLYYYDGLANQEDLIRLSVSKYMGTLWRHGWGSQCSSVSY